MQKKTILSGIQSSGSLTLGNYLGALKSFKTLQDSGDFRCLYFIADLHSITVKQNPEELRARSLEIMKIYLALGLGGGEHSIFFQSHVPQHAELGWVLGCYTNLGQLARMTQFKDKTKKITQGAADSLGLPNVSSGLFTYPILMAADILLYQADLVPVGADQKQHLELTRDIAERFNSIYGDVFKLPDGYIPKHGARIMSLQDPSAKMSKSDTNPNGYILLLDSPEIIEKKVKRAVTDSLGFVAYDEENPERAGMNNLLTILSAINGSPIPQIVADFEGRGYGDFKSTVAQAIISELSPIQAKFQELSQNEALVRETFTQSAQSARLLAAQTLKSVYEKIGFIPAYPPPIERPRTSSSIK